MTTSIPEIYNLQKLLQKQFGSSWKYLNHTTKYLTAPGENYGSTILSIVVQYKENDDEKQLYLVGKLCPPSDLLKEAFLTDITFKKEIDAYLQVSPTIDEIQQEFGVANKLNAFAKCYGARMNLLGTRVVDNDAVIILENLKIKGYTLEDRMNGFDLDTSRLILQSLAKVHATVIAIRLKKPQDFQNNILPACETVNNGGVMIDGFIDSATKIAKMIPECEPFYEKFKTILDARKSLGGLIFPVKTNENFYSMIHTDFWTNNIMILKQNERTIDVKIVDLQLCDYGSIARDLLFFLYSSVELDVFANNYDHLIELYYATFIIHLTEFNCNLPEFSWDLFQKEINDVAPHEFFHIVFMLKPIFSERGSIESMEAMDVNDFGRIDNCGKVYKEKVKQICLSFAERNWI